MNRSDNQNLLGNLAAKSKPPILFTVFTLLLLIDGVFTILGSFPALLIGGILAGGIFIIIGLGKIIVAVGLRKMKIWSLYGLTIIVILMITPFFKGQKDLITIFTRIYEIIILVYFWYIFKKQVSKIWIIGILAVVLAGGIFAWQYFGTPKEEIKISEEVAKTSITQWREYVLEKITDDFQSPNFMDRRLIGVKDDGQRDVIIPSVKELMGWQRTPGETGFYPVQVSFPPYSSKIFFVKYQAGTGHSGGFFMLDTKTLTFKELSIVGQVYENYNNYLSIVSPSGFKIASYGNNDLYLLDLTNNKVELLDKVQTGETFYLADKTPEFKWIDDHTIQYPVHSAQDIYAPPIEIRQISIETKKVEKVTERETANWKTYRNEAYGFELKYSENYKISTKIATRVAPAIISSTPPLEITFDVYENPTQMPLFEWVKSDLVIHDLSIKWERILVNNIEGLKSPTLGNMDGGVEYTALIPRGDKIFNLLFATKAPGTESELEVFDKILSTFRFLE